MTKKFFHIKYIWTVLKIGAWTAFAFLVILFFLLFPTSMEACCNPKVGEQYMIKVYVCLSYLGIYFWLLLLRSIKGRGFKTAVAVLSVLIIISCGFLIKTTLTNKRIQTLENHWRLSLPTDVKLKFFDGHSLGFVDRERYAYYVFALNRQWADTTCFLKSKFPADLTIPFTLNVPFYKEFGNSIFAQNEKKYFRLFFEQIYKRSMFDIPNKFYPKWDTEPLQWGFKVGDNDELLFGIFYPNTMRLILFEYHSYD